MRKPFSLQNCSRKSKQKRSWPYVVLKNPTNELVDDALWFIQEAHILATQFWKKMLRFSNRKSSMVASSLAEMVGYQDGRERPQCSSLKYMWEKLFAGPAHVQERKTKFKSLIKKECLHPGQIYNMDETGLNFKCFFSQ